MSAPSSFALDRASKRRATFVGVAWGLLVACQSGDANLGDVGAVELGRETGESDDAGDGVARDSAAPSKTVGLEGRGHVVFRIGDRWYRIALEDGAREDLSARFDRLSSGFDMWIAPSALGPYLVLATTRFGCFGGESCLVLVHDDVIERVETPLGQVVPAGRPAVSPSGDKLVYPAAASGGRVDLFAIERTKTGWSAPRNLTSTSAHAFFHDVALDTMGDRVLSDCGPDPYGEPGTALCSVRFDGTELRELMAPSRIGSALHHPSFGVDGAIVFESGDEGEVVMRLDPGASSPTRLTPLEQHDDNSPCVLPDGQIASLWLGREGSAGHELKIMTKDGARFELLLEGVDILDVGIGCGQ